MNLYDLKVSSNCEIGNIPEIPLLNSIGVRKGIRVEVVSKQPFSGPIVIKIAKRNIAIAKEIANKIKVKEVAV
ncbi:ferrous iron transport protein A [Clostridium sp. MSJ-11]|uniref:Ferrous iron transport protein A n=1 Tax=Clostridium mobile TaxID=2841512 RepID=A0ABS6ELA7_9CLOT|nr:FeoA family protein [Clostridium mobile]MBU5485818.1 ferrous iron transport protein A [Clostridium mobile]